MAENNIERLAKIMQARNESEQQKNTGSALPAVTIQGISGCVDKYYDALEKQCLHVTSASGYEISFTRNSLRKVESKDGYIEHNAIEGGIRVKLVLNCFEWVQEGGESVSDHTEEQYRFELNKGVVEFRRGSDFFSPEALAERAISKIVTYAENNERRRKNRNR